MMRRFLPFVVFGVLLVAAALAFTNRERATEPAPAAPVEPPSAEFRPPPAATPPPHAPMGTENQENASLSWTRPPSWREVPNPNPMRIATYRIGPADATDDVAEVSVSRAGGTPEANVQRWLGQFQGTPSSKRSQRRPHGVNVTIVEASGTYGGGMSMPGMVAIPHADYTLLGAIAEPANGSPYFFKLVGPTAVVNQARESFDALIDSLAPR